jgi:predicted MPP superfamily phosphohydrolase
MPNSSTAVRWGRRPRFLPGVAALVAILFLGLLGWGSINARVEPVVRTAYIALADWPANEAPIKVVLLSDIHFGNMAMDDNRLDRIVRQTNALRPDLILLAGDFIVGHNASGAEARAKRLAAPLANLKAPLGVLAVLGNHDNWTHSNSITAALSRAHITVLENQAARTGPIVVVGVGDVFSGHDRSAQALLAAQRYGRPIVVLTHSPDLSPQLPSEAQLVLAGHTHCGQIVFPWGQALATHSPVAKGRRLYDPRSRCGLVHDSGRTVIVTGGVGSGTVPVRFGAPPDLWLITVGPTKNH